METPATIELKPASGYKPSTIGPLGATRGFLLSNGLLVALAIIVIVMSFLSPVFLTEQNLINILLRSTVVGTLAIGMTLVIIARGLDLSVGNTATLSGLLCLGLMRYEGLTTPEGVIAALLTGIGVGLINALLVVRLRVNALIGTIATMTILSGLIWVYSNGANISPAPGLFQVIAFTRFGHILPLIVLIWAALGLIMGFVLSWTRFGRAVYAVGGNPKAAHLSGINVGRTQMMVYVISGFFAALGGLLLVARLQAAIPSAGAGIELTVIAAVVIGGTSLFGGVGSIHGTFLGVLLVSLVSNAINLLGVPSSYDDVFSGSVIALAAIIDAVRTLGTRRV
jgi:ribose transport system permease protein